jgi:hypothetical protein
MTTLQRLARVIYEAGAIGGTPWAEASIWAKGKAEWQALAVLGVLDDMGVEVPE